MAIDTTQTVTTAEGAYYKAFFNSSNEGFCIIEMIFDANGRASDYRFLEVNPVFEKQTGLKNAAGKRMRDLQPQHEEHWFELYGEIARTRTPMQFEREASHLAGGVWYEVSAFPFEEPEKNRVAILFNDITARKHHEQAALEKQNWLESQKQAFQDAMGGKPLAVALQPLIEAVTRQTGGAARTAFYTIPNEGEGLHLVAGMTPAYAKEVNGFEVGPESIACGLAMHTGQPVITRDVEADPHWQPFIGLARAHGYRACWSFPVHTEGGPVLGSLAMYFEQPRDPSPKELELAGILSHAAAIIISRHNELTQRAQAQKALKKRESEMAAIQEIGGVAGFDIDLLDNLTGIRSPEYRKLHGLPDTVTQETHDQWLKRLHPEDRQKAEQNLLDTLKGSAMVYESEYRIIRPSDGRQRWIYAKADIYRNELGEPIRLFGAHIDITIQKEMEIIARESRQLLSAIFSEAAVGLSVIDKSGSFLRANNTLCRFLGRRRQEVLQLKVTDVTAPDYIAPSLEALEDLFSTGQPVTLDKQYLRPDGSLVWANSTLSLLKATAGSEPLVVIVTADISERKKAEETLTVFNNRLEYIVQKRTQELQEQQELLQATLDSTHEMVQVFKAIRHKGEVIDFKYVLQNKTSEHYYGPVIGESLFENNPLVVAGGIFSIFKEVVDTGAPQQFEKYYEHRQFEGWFYQSAVKMDDGIVVFSANITDKKKAEQEIIGLNKTLLANNRELRSLHSELTTFTDVAANDYNATLEMLYIYLEHIIKSDALKMSDSGKSNVRRAQSAIQKLKLLTEDMIAFSNIRNQDQDFSEVNLKNLLNDLLEDLAPKISLSQAHIAVEGELPVIQGFPLLLSLLFYHLLDNALKFISRGSLPIIKITCKPVTANDGAQSQEDAPYYEVSVTDNGIGFPENEAENIFTIFYRLHEKKAYKGSGIGLAICRKIMDMHGGFIKAHADIGNGASFSCYFPKAR